MADEPYVPAGGWEAAGYSGFSPAPSALATVNQAQFNTIAPTMSAPQQLIGTSAGSSGGQAMQAGYTPQTLIDAPYAQTRGGYSPGGYGAAGPAMQNFLTSPGLAQRQAAARARTAAPAPAANPYGDLSGSQVSNPYGDLSGSQPSNPYGDLSGSQPSNPYGDLSASQPAPQYNDFATRGATMPGSSPYGSLGGSTMPTASTTPSNPYGNLSGASASLNPLADFVARYRSGAPPTPPPRPSSIDTGGAGLYGASPPVNTAPQNPASPYQMPTTSATYGGLEPSFDAMSNADAQSFDQSYMDSPQGPYGSLMGGNDGPSTYETMAGQTIPQPSQPIDTSPQNPAGPMFTPTASDETGQSFQTPGPMPAQQRFSQGMWPNASGSTYGGLGGARTALANAISPAPAQQMSGPAQAYGALTRAWTPMQTAQDSPFGKVTNRAPQSGGFMSLGANVAGRRY